MRVAQCMHLADDTRPNGCSDRQKIGWLNRLEARIQTEVQQLPSAQLRQYDAVSDRNAVLLVSSPHDKIYWSYLTAMIEESEGDAHAAESMRLFEIYYAAYLYWYRKHAASKGGEKREKGLYRQHSKQRCTESGSTFCQGKEGQEQCDPPERHGRQRQVS